MSVHQELLEEALRSGLVENAHLFLNNETEPLARRAVQELNNRLGTERVLIKDIRDLHQLIAEHDYVFVSKFGNFTSLGELRCTIEEPTFSICGVLHAACLVSPLLAYTAVLLTAEEQDAIVATSNSGMVAIESGLEQAARFLSERLHIANLRPQIRIVKIPLGVRDDFSCSVDKHEARKLLGIPTEDTLILYIGRLTDCYKADLEPLLLALSAIRRKHKCVRMMIAGQDTSGRYRKQIEQSGISMGVADLLVLYTNFSHFIKPLLYRAADIFVSPVDNIQETFGLTLLEAMAMELPVVASDWSGYKEIMVHGETGFLVPTYWNCEAACEAAWYSSCYQSPESETWIARQTIVDTTALTENLEHLVANRDLRGRFGRAGRKRVDDLFRWRTIIRSYEDLWREMSHIRQFSVRQRRSRGLFSFNEMFRHYGSRVIDLSQQVSVCEQSSEILRRCNFSLLPDGLLGAETKRLLEALRNEPVSLEAITRSGCPETLKAAVWLMKKGYLKPIASERKSAL